ncbi:hypothetical protein [Rubritalea marina]|uniref:hypothetical protein n=1 Tax=Rubritalea marina TaxID=361055 RepID=UPI000374399E|nr:hypothetical protein [Rubritalea marina]
MKNTILISAIALLSVGASHAEKSNADIQNDFLKTAKKYDQKAELAAIAGNNNDAAIYKKLADMKRDAAKVGGNYDWTEYHKLQGQLNHGNDGAKKHGEKHAKKVKKQSYSVEGAAQKYDQLAAQSIASGNAEHAAIYKRMAEIKREASKSGGSYDWSEYHELEGKLKK